MNKKRLDLPHSILLSVPPLGLIHPESTRQGSPDGAGQRTQLQDTQQDREGWTVHSLDGIANRENQDSIY